jgi:hypothetical protein
MEQYSVQTPNIPPLLSEGWERVPEGRVRALLGRFRLCNQRALIRPSATFSHAARGRRGKYENAPARDAEAA